MHKLLLVMDSLRYDAFQLAETKFLDKLRTNKLTRAYSPSCFTPSSCLLYLMNYPPIQPYVERLFSEFNEAVWLPKAFRYALGYKTYILTGNPWLNRLNNITENWFYKYFQYKFTDLPKDDIQDIFMHLNEIFNSKEKSFVFALSASTHHPIKNTKVEDADLLEYLDYQKEIVEILDQKLKELSCYAKGSIEVIITSDHAEILGGKSDSTAGHDPSKLIKFEQSLVEIPFAMGEISNCSTFK